MKFSVLPQPAGLLKLMLNLFQLIHFEGRELYFHGFIGYAFVAGLHQDTCKPMFQTWYDTGDHWTLQYDSSVNSPDLQSRLQGYGKASACVIILL